MPTITLGAHTVQLRRPASATQRYEIWLAVAAVPDRAFCAALGSCLPPQPKGSPLSLVFTYDMTFSPLAYGGQVLDSLLAAGFSREEIRGAGIIAHNWLSEEFREHPDGGGEAESKLAGFSAAPVPET